jgi:hypothetical protein
MNLHRLLWFVCLFGLFGLMYVQNVASLAHGLGLRWQHFLLAIPLFICDLVFPELCSRLLDLLLVPLRLIWTVVTWIALPATAIALGVATLIAGKYLALSGLGVTLVYAVSQWEARSRTLAFNQTAITILGLAMIPIGLIATGITAWG